MEKFSRCLDRVVVVGDVLWCGLWRWFSDVLLWLWVYEGGSVDVMEVGG